MNEPKRWLDGGGGPSESLELLRVARSPIALDDAARRRTRRRVSALSALPIAAAFGWWSTLALGAVLGVTGSFAVNSLLAPTRTAPHAEAPVSAVSVSNRELSVLAPPSAVTPTAPPPPLDTVKSAVSAVRNISARPGGKAGGAADETASVAMDPLKREVALLESARRSLASDPSGARLALLEHQRRFPTGVLRVERELLMVDVLLRLGERSEAEAHAAALEAGSSQNLYKTRLDQLLGRTPQ